MADLFILRFYRPLVTDSPDDELASRLDAALRDTQQQEREDARRAQERQAGTDERLAAALAKQNDESGGD